ncbi:hypothetical protein AKO1_010787 [Acrasis kona]|uniref:Protein ARV n=1 Tax=Acrasis kona TaxID=1008807 RepID=A0AAW2YM01_9EUKA
MTSESAPSFVCVECNANVPHITFVHFGSIRLHICNKCGRVADKYVEYELVTIMLDLLLHCKQAYSHVLHNLIPHHSAQNTRVELIRMALFSILLDACKKLNFSEHGVLFYRLFFASMMSFLAFIVGTLIASVLVIKLLNGGYVKKAKNINSHFGSYGLITKVGILTSFAQVGYIPMMIWDYPGEIIHTVSLFHFSSNMVGSKVALQCDGYIPALFVVGFGVICRTLCYRFISLYAAPLLW